MAQSIRLLTLAANADNQNVTNLLNAVKSSSSAGVIVQGYCNNILQQPDIALPADLVSKLPPINEYLKASRDHASNYLNNIQKEMIGTVQDVNGYSTQFTAFYNLINQNINTWKMGNQAAKEEALGLLQALKTDIKTKQAKVIVVSGDLAKFLIDLNGDVSNFNTATSRADVIIGGDEGALASLDSTIKDLDKVIAGTAAGVALSGLTIIGGAFMIAVGSVASFVTAGTSTPLVVAGVAVVVVGAGGLTASSIILAKSIQAKSDAIRQKAVLESSLNFLHTFKSTIGQLNESASNAVTQVNNMKNAWGILGANMDNVVSSIDAARTYSDLPVTVKAYLDTANGQWADVKAAVQTINAQLTDVQTTTLKNGSGQLTALDEKSIEAATKKLAA